LTVKVSSRARSSVPPGSAFAGLRFPAEVVTDALPVCPAVLDELIPSAWHHVEQYANNRIEADHSPLKHRLRPMRGLRTDRTAAIIITGHAFVQNLRRGYYELRLDPAPARCVATAFAELAHGSDRCPDRAFSTSTDLATQQRRSLRSPLEPDQAHCSHS
jgi:hypothetical protein